ncbi:GAF domain-containing sensor histidine kinase [Flavobacterium humi]|uniref:histidine kinase n=1 Tax=Flavobacterium humi TaxID=2562683 RepID=A0A4Z0LC47_9FLAO|nr:HAMP domain-containing sensor histidine kinase [Flavobacterium humi]TGD59461.1 sensor histidine kinase [Flavobacterium humi]
MNLLSTIEEKIRLNILKSYDILDTDPESDYDNITFLASRICNTPISTITFIDQDRQWFKSKVGFEHNESPREVSFCALAIQRTSRTVVIPNIKEDKEFNIMSVLNGFEKGGFYASVALRDPDGYDLGTLCVIDHTPREMTGDQLKSLEILADQVCKLLELRKKNVKLLEKNELLNLKYSELEHFANVVSHDIKSPLNNIISLVSLFEEYAEGKFNEEGREYLDCITASSYRLRDYVDGLLEYYRSDTVNVLHKEDISINEVLNKIICVLDPKREYHFILPATPVTIRSVKPAIEQILLNLISNAIKYNDKKPVVIEIKCEESENGIMISVKDNGIGIEKKDLDVIFSFFTTLKRKDRFGHYGTGIGLATVEKIVRKINGKINVNSIPNEGSEFTIILDI